MNLYIVQSYALHLVSIYLCRRVLKNRIVDVPKPNPELGHPLKKSQQKEKRTLNQAKGAIRKHINHINMLTNPQPLYHFSTIIY